MGPRHHVLAFAAWIATATAVVGANYPAPQEGDYTIRDFHFRSGETLPELRMHYLTFGRPQRDQAGRVRNAVLILHGTTGSSAQFLRPEFADELYGKDQPFDVSRFYLIIVDNIGHGKSSKPSDGSHARFPRYGYHDMIEAQYRLLTEGLNVNHLRLVFGTSMGGMHTWMWGELHPDFMDGLMPMASVPGPISGRNREWRRIVIDSIRGSPDWQGGDYTDPPSGMRTAIEMLYFMGDNPVLRWQKAPTLAAADRAIDDYVTNKLAALDANDVLYAFEASADYDPAPELEKIQAPLLAINSADDLINPPELRILEREIKRVKHGKAIVIPFSDKTRGHGSHTTAVLWKKDLVKFLKQTNPKTSKSDVVVSASATARAPELFVARFETTKGAIQIEVHRDWAPMGVDHFYELLRAGYYDGNRFFRVIKDKWAQFGINGEPRVAQAWRGRTIPDDPPRESNVRGTVAYAFAVPDGRTTQVFINLRDNSATHDTNGFVPFGKIIGGMEVADALNAEYGETSGGGIRAGKQDPLFNVGNLYLNEHFPHLDSIIRATIEKPEVSGRKSEVSGQRSEVGGLRSEVGGLRSEVGGQRSEVGRQTGAEGWPPASDLRLLTSNFRPLTSDLRLPTISACVGLCGGAYSSSPFEQ